jgi:hypothetical protein
MKILFFIGFLNLINAFNFQGATKPLGVFDPFGFIDKSETIDLLKLREAELKHGRWAMVSSVTIPLLETQHNKPAIHEFDNLSSQDKVLILTLISAFEFSSILKGWENPFLKNGTNKYFTMKEDYQPGDIGLRLSSSVTDDLLNKELNNGRLAMIGSIGMIVQELVTDKPLFH